MLCVLNMIESLLYLLLAGMTGSCHDNLVLRASSLWPKLCGSSAFDEGQYIVGDSAYTVGPHIIAAYQYTRGSRDKVNFNYCIAKMRYINEHTIGILKN